MLLLSRNEALKWKRFLWLAANANNPYSNRSFIDLPASNSHLTIHLQARRNGWDTGDADCSGAPDQIRCRHCGHGRQGRQGLVLAYILGFNTLLKETTGEKEFG